MGIKSSLMDLWLSCHVGLILFTPNLLQLNIYHNE